MNIYYPSFLFCLFALTAVSALEMEYHFSTNFCRYANSGHLRKTDPQSAFQVLFWVDPRSGFKRSWSALTFRG